MGGVFDALATNGHWWWVVFGLVLFVVEVMTMSLFLLWPGLAALILAIVVFLGPQTPIAVQFGLFGALSVGLTYLCRGWARSYLTRAVFERPELNQRGAQLKGRRVVAVEPFQNGEGSVRLDDSQWLARLEEGDAAEGENLRVKDVVGTMLLVERILGDA